MNTFQLIMPHVLKVEGGEKFTDHPNDKGGPTKYGITLNALSSYRGSQQTAEDVKNLSEAEAMAIYKKNYYDKLGLDLVNDPDVALALMDQGVNRGTRMAAIMAQVVANEAVGAKLTVDGDIGPKTAAALLKNPQLFCREFIQAAQHGYWDIVQRNGSQAVFFRGWLNRTHILQDRIWNPLGIGQPPMELPEQPKPVEGEKPVQGSDHMAPYLWAKKELGVSEIVGPKHNPRIVWYHGHTHLDKKMASMDETPWCASFVCTALEETGFKSTDSAAAISFANYGVEGDGSQGDIAVLSRDGGNHVAFIHQNYRKGDSQIVLLGGNQGNKVSVRSYDAGRIKAIRRVKV